jgi:hypothetical protein
MSFEPDDVLSVSPLIVLKYLGRLLSFATIDRRKVWTFRHASVAQAVRQRYLQSTGEIKLVNEIMVAVFRGSRTAGEVDEDSTEAAAAAAVMLFPQPLNRADNGAANTRRVRFHWYFLLYTGNFQQ